MDNSKLLVVINGMSTRLKGRTGSQLIKKWDKKMRPKTFTKKQKKKNSRRLTEKLTKRIIKNKIVYIVHVIESAQSPPCSMSMYHQSPDPPPPHPNTYPCFYPFLCIKHVNTPMWFYRHNLSNLFFRK